MFIDIDAVKDQLRMAAQRTTEHFYIGDDREGKEEEKEEGENIDEEPEDHSLPKVPVFPFNAEGEDEDVDEAWHDIPVVEEEVGDEHEEAESADDAVSEAEEEAVFAPQEEPEWFRKTIASAVEQALRPQHWALPL